MVPTNYNSVVATFCHNIAHDLPIQVNDPNRSLELVYVDDVVAAFIDEMDDPQEREGVFVAPDPIPSYTVTLADLVGSDPGVPRNAGVAGDPRFLYAV